MSSLGVFSSRERAGGYIVDSTEYRATTVKRGEYIMQHSTKIQVVALGSVVFTAGATIALLAI